MRNVEYGVISTHGLETLVLYVFHSFHPDLHSPLHVSDDAWRLLQTKVPRGVQIL